MYCRSGPLLACVFCKKKSQKNPVILLSSHATAQEEEVQGRHGGNPEIKPKIFTSFSKFMGGIYSADVMLYTYLDERWTVRYWKKVDFNIIARLVMNIYREPGKLRSRYNYTVSLIGSLGEERLVLWDSARADDPRGP
jgi:hypothetical protein